MDEFNYTDNKKTNRTEILTNYTTNSSSHYLNNRIIIMNI